MKVENENKPVSRKKFVIWGAGALAVLTAARFFFRTKSKKEKTTTVKMLTQDGKLVEVEVSKLPTKRKKVSVEQLQNWIQKKTSTKI
jgi:hypothetical protein